MSVPAGAAPEELPAISPEKTPAQAYFGVPGEATAADEAALAGDSPKIRSAPSGALLGVLGLNGAGASMLTEAVVRDALKSLTLQPNNCFRGPRNV